MGYNVYLAFGFDIGTDPEGKLLQRPESLGPELEEKAKQMGLEFSGYHLDFLSTFTHQRNQSVQDEIFIMPHTQLGPYTEYAVVVRKSIVEGYRGVLTKVTETQLKKKNFWYHKIKEFCTKYNIPYKKPTWMLLSLQD
jgi:hypothetical protein